MASRRTSPARRFAVTLLGLILVLGQERPSSAAGIGCDAATQARLDFLEGRLDAGQPRAKWWWRSWMDVFLIGAVYETTVGATSHDHGEEADAYLSAIESLGGIADLVLTDRPAVRGSESSRTMPATTGDECAKRLAVAEREMAGAADEAHQRYEWTIHLINLGVSVGHGALVAGVWGDHARGAESFAINEVVSEAQVWTEPSRARDDWADYRRTFGESATSVDRRNRWQITAGPVGISLRYTF